MSGVRRGGEWRGSKRCSESKIGVVKFPSPLSPARGIFPEYLVVAEAVSALKKTFARILLIVVSSGYGTVM